MRHHQVTLLCVPSVVFKVVPNVLPLRSRCQSRSGFPERSMEGGLRLSVSRFLPGSQWGLFGRLNWRTNKRTSVVLALERRPTFQGWGCLYPAHVFRHPFFPGAFDYSGPRPLVTEQPVRSDDSTSISDGTAHSSYTSRYLRFGRPKRAKGSDQASGGYL